MIELCCFRVNPHSVVCLNVMKLLAWSKRYIWSLRDSNKIWTHNHLVRKWSHWLNGWGGLNDWTQASLAKWLSVCLRTMWLWVWISLLSLKLQIWHLLWVRSSLTFSQTIECGFTMKHVRDIIITYSQ